MGKHKSPRKDYQTTYAHNFPCIRVTKEHFHAIQQSAIIDNTTIRNKLAEYIKWGLAAESHCAFKNTNSRDGGVVVENRKG